MTSGTMNFHSSDGSVYSRPMTEQEYADFLEGAYGPLGNYSSPDVHIGPLPDGGSYEKSPNA